MTREQDYLDSLRLSANSLNDLLGIINNTLENIDMRKLNPRHKQFNEFRFTFFALMVKANGIADMMMFRADYLRKEDRFIGIFKGIEKMKYGLKKAHAAINSGHIEEGKRLIKKSYSGYEGLFGEIMRA
jgi:hypothetical protein